MRLPGRATCPCLRTGLQGGLHVLTLTLCVESLAVQLSLLFGPVCAAVPLPLCVLWCVVGSLALCVSLVLLGTGTLE